MRALRLQCPHCASIIGCNVGIQGLMQGPDGREAHLHQIGMPVMQTGMGAVPPIVPVTPRQARGPVVDMPDPPGVETEDEVRGPNATVVSATVAPLPTAPQPDQGKQACGACGAQNVIPGMDYCKTCVSAVVGAFLNGFKRTTEEREAVPPQAAGAVEEEII